jgi:hypothetical protein
VEPLRDLRGDVHRVPDRQRFRGVSTRRHQRPEIWTVHILHRQVIVVVDLPEIIDLNDVRVVETDGDVRLGDEHLHETVVLGVFRENLLDDEFFFEPLGADAFREIDLGHPSGADLLDQFVPSERFRHDAPVLCNSTV